jgi:hypothetical protein
MTGLPSNSKKWLALSLGLLVVGSLSACNYNERRAEVRGVEETAPRQAEEPAVRDLRSLQPGRSIGYYSGQFARLGYQVEDVDAINNQYVYDLRKGNERYQVSLGVAADQDRVNNVNVRSYRAVMTDQEGTGTQGTQTAQSGANRNQADQEAARITQAVSSLQTGKKAYEYIPLISRHGQVTEYHLDNDRAEIEFEANNRRYQAKLTVNPQTQQVSAIDVDRNVWELF